MFIQNIHNKIHNNSIKKFKKISTEKTIVKTQKTTQLNKQQKQRIVNSAKARIVRKYKKTSKQKNIAKGQ